MTIQPCRAGQGAERYKNDLRNWGTQPHAHDPQNILFRCHIPQDCTYYAIVEYQIECKKIKRRITLLSIESITLCNVMPCVRKSYLLVTIIGKELSVKMDRDRYLNHNRIIMSYHIVCCINVLLRHQNSK